jgi:ribosomal protein S18 acetylase RimI-like enzyme
LIIYSDSHDIELDQLTALFNSVGWQFRTADRDRLAAMVRGSMFVVSAWNEDQLVGFARAISDGAFNAYVSTVAVLPAYQRQGIGRELMRQLMEGRDGIMFVLHARPEAYDFYLQLGLGFEPADNILKRPRTI